ncbi:P-loop containing nucleoside triphosphate hydrolase protein, partial [Mycena olivaceomarginata]
MHQFFTSDKGKQHIYVLYGLGGAGKTQIALKFIKELSSYFSDVSLVDTSTKDTISTGLKSIAVAKNIGDSSKDGLLWLTSKVEEWLLFFDNADDPSIDLNDFIPQCEHGNVIIASRNPGLRVHAGAHSPISNMEEEDAVALLLKSAKQDASPSNLKFATEIVKTLGYLALAITQAGAFISKSEDLSSYLDLYKKNQGQLLAEKPSQSHDHYAWTVYTTWQISFDRLKAPAAMFLLLCSFLHHEGISEDIFCNASMYEFPCDGPSKAKLKEPLKFLSYFLGPTREWDSLRFLDVTNEIKAYSLIRFDSEKKVFAIHPLVHVWSRTILTDQESYEFIIQCILGMAIANIPEQDMQLASLKILPHLESSQHFETHVVTLFKEAYWRIYYESGKANQAKVLAVDVFEQQKVSFGEDHLGTLRAGANLASTYRKLGQLKMAEELEVVVLEKCKQLLGDDHPDTLCAMGNLAITSLDLGERKTAEELQVVVLEKRTQLLGDSHPNILHAMGNLVLTYSKLGEFRKAQELEVVVLEKWKQHLGNSHPDTLCAMGNLAFTYSKLGDFRKAEELQVLVLEKHKQLLSENHLGTLSAMGNLGSTYLQLGEFRKAEELNVIVLEKRKQL